MRKTTKNGCSKMLVVGVLAVLPILGIIGCATNAANVIRYDTSSPPEQDCTIVLKGGHVANEVTKITAFDGNSVDWRSKQTGFLMVGDYKIKIPAGKHSLTGWSGQPGLTAGAGTPQMSSTYTFVAGHTYQIKAEGSLQVIDITK